MKMLKQNLKALKTVFKDPLFLLLGASLAVNLLVLEYFIFSRSTTWEVFFASNTAFYNWTSIALITANAVLFGTALAMVLFILRRKLVGGSGGIGNSFLGAALGAISSGCPVCGAWLLPVAGIASSLAAFPLQGLEIKLLSIILLVFAINEATKSILGVCPAPPEKLFSSSKEHFILTFNRTTLPQLKPVVVAALALALVYFLPILPQKYKISFAKKGSVLNSPTVLAQEAKGSTADLFAAVNPPAGYTLDVEYGDLGPQILKSGAIDLEKFQNVYDRAGQPLTAKQLKILKEGLGEKITIKKDNAYFLLNFFWALGLANKNPILEEGPITKYGKEKINSFASTGGWTLGTTETMGFYSSAKIIELTPKQQLRVEEVADNVYRPCCGNPTSFPDCNHGMALLAVLELLAVNGASTDQMYEAAKYFNAFWFPQQYLDIATYFKVKEGKSFKEIDPRIVVSREFSSAQGWSKTKRWLATNNLVEEAPRGGGGCGV